MTSNYTDQINIEPADLNKIPSEPIPASTVLLLRDGKNTVEVFMLKRSAASNFGNAWVFPGGKLDSEDLMDKFSNQTVPNEKEIGDIEVSYLLAAIRECFEECGVLIANRNSGEVFIPQDEKEIKILKKYQFQINNNEISFYNILNNLNLYPAINNLTYLSHWTTPTTEKKRYSTKFYLASLPSKQDAVHDGFEGVDSLWISPEKALSLYKSGKFPIILPTIKSLEAIRLYKSTNELLSKFINSNAS